MCRPPPPGKLLVQSVDFFRSFWDDPYLLGKVRADMAMNPDLCCERAHWCVCARSYMQTIACMYTVVHAYASAAMYMAKHAYVCAGVFQHLVCVHLQVAANHALGDVWAMGGKPTSALALAVVPLMADHLVAEELTLLLSGAVEVRAQRGGPRLCGAA